MQWVTLESTAVSPRGVECNRTGLDAVLHGRFDAFIFAADCGEGGRQGTLPGELPHAGRDTTVGTAPLHWVSVIRHGTLRLARHSSASTLCLSGRVSRCIGPIIQLVVTTMARKDLTCTSRSSALGTL